MALLEVRGLKTSFFSDAGRTKAVDGISFSVDRGRTLGIVGESGSGKTVTALSIMGLLPDAARVIGGSVLLDGEELIGAPESRMRRVRGSRVGMVFQDPLSSLNPVYTIGAQIGEAVRLHDVGAASVDAEVELLLRQVEMPDPRSAARSYPHQLSGGMRQRATIAIALAGRPELLVADEPTTALDVTVQAQILDLLARLQSQSKMAMILITHDLGVVASVADNVVVMRQGRVVETGAVDALFAHPTDEYTKQLLDAMPRLGVG
ncbi:MAG: ABC transporter ATP-binding protein [Actinobacteria bacterium]|nr:MAG: ABC transporter ATP-binding protein [Actinomycetota bacterium]